MRKPNILLVNQNIIVLCLTLFICVNCFNLENRLPIIKQGEPGSYFGYSVASHVTGTKDDTDNVKW